MTALLETKFHVPRSRRRLVERPRLRERLRAGSDAALILVSAPAGFGKSTVLTEWLAMAPDEGRATAWLSLDERDSEPAAFLSYVIAALETATAGLGAGARSLLASPDAPIDAVVAALLNDLQRATHDVVLVLDDYHVIDAQGIHDAMAFLLDHLPPHVHLVISSRADPPLPLARLRARGELVEIRAADLRFTSGEAAAYLTEVMGLELVPSQVTALEDRTEGWIAALQLAALSMQGRDDIAGFIATFTGDDRYIVDYLVGEVLQQQPEDIRSFLLQTSILGRLNGSLCDAVTGATDGRAMLERLERANLFVVPLDDRRHWYRYHHLFADVLQAHLLDEQPDLVPELHRRASSWYDQAGDPAAAIAHAMAGADFERAAELIELATPTMRLTRQEATLRHWVASLPEELFPDRPVLTVARVGALMASGDFDGVELLLRSVDRWLDPAGDGPTPIVADREEFARLPAQVPVFRAALALIAGDIEGTITHANRVLELAEPSDDYRRGGAAALLGLAHWTVGDLETARGRYAASVRHFVDGGYLPDVMGCSLALADIQIAQGRLQDAMRTFESALEHAHGRPGMRGTADMHVGLADLLVERDELDEALRHLEASREHGEHAGLPQNPYRSRVAQARFRQAKGDLPGALELLAEAERVYNTDFSPAIRPIPARLARVHLARGNVDAALRWARERGLTVQDDLSYVQEFEHVTLARTLLAHRSIEDALGLLRRLLAAAEDGRREGSAVEILSLLALAHDARGDRAASAVALHEALERAEREGYVRVFVDEAPAAVPLLRTHALKGVAGDHARRVLTGAAPAAAAQAAGNSNGNGNGLVDELSGRELEVLRLLRSDLSGPDIARELMVSLNTMRTHTKSIYSKLGANSRREAVRRAAELGL
jgi:LuxR family maltose regulon positive regulatory protein